MTIIVIILLLLLLISKTIWKVFYGGKKSNVSVCCFCPFSCGSLSILGMGQTVISSVICCSCLHNLCSHHQRVTLFSPLYFPSFCSLIGWMFSAWHHHCLREHCSPGLRSRCPYVYKYDHLSTAAVNISSAAAFKESSWFRCLILFHLFSVWFIDFYAFHKQSVFQIFALFAFVLLFISSTFSLLGF